MSATRTSILYDAPGDILSPSSMSKYLGCSAKYKYAKVDKLPDPKSGALVLGSSVHEALGENFAQKVETFRDLDQAGVSAIYRTAWDRMAPEAEFREDEDPAALRVQGEELALKYLAESAPEIQPAAVELHVSGRIGGVLVQGYIDLLDTTGRVIDIKTAARKPSAISADYKLQLATYRQLCERASGEARLDTLVKTKSPQIVQIPCTVDASDVAAVETLYPLVQRSIRAMHWLPNRASTMCSRKHCSFWRACQKEWGGIVNA